MVFCVSTHHTRSHWVSRSILNRCIRIRFQNGELYRWEFSRGNEKLEVEVGSEIKFDNILMLGDSDGVKLGDALKGAAVTAKVLSQGRADKVRIIKFRRRKHHMKRQGHRQYYTEIEITGIAG